ncbi:helix-turn-helix transcriptional regulator [Ruegeria lacuscaerulensis]|uniref:helix-turn-helix transcriptional regulator n=1 Tax=Ruegeria lacuscaerulensis TaxID=55218 RepID=UPI00147E121B|nr:hypothetical protein [Ruegeria lacuscaerulensis]
MEILSLDISRLYAGLNGKGDLSPLLETVCQEFGGSTAMLEIGLADGQKTLLNHCPHWPCTDQSGTGMTGPRPTVGELRRLVALKPGMVLSGQEMAEILRITRFSIRIREAALRKRAILGVTARCGMCAEVVVVWARNFTREYNDCDGRHLKSILLHLDKIRELGLSIGEYRQERRALSTVLNHISSGCLLVNEHCYLRFMNAAAGRAIAGSRVLRVGSKRLGGHTYATSRLLWSRVLGIARGPIDKTEILSLCGPQDIVPTVLRLVHVVPVTNRPEQRVAIIIPGGRSVQDDLLSEVGRVYGLTPAETRLLDAIAREETLSGAGRRIGVGANTAHTHLQHLYTKLDVHSHACLVRFLSSRGII